MHPDLPLGIDCSETLIQVLVVEDTISFRSFVSELIAQVAGEEGRFVLSDNWSPISISQNVHVISDIFHFTINDRKSISLLYKYLSEIAISKDITPMSYEIEKNTFLWMDTLINPELFTDIR